MTYQQLIDSIKQNGIPSDWFSINDGLKPNAYILNRNYIGWDFFFLDERGQRIGYKVFTDEGEAFDFFLQKLILEKKYPPSIPPSSVGI